MDSYKQAYQFCVNELNDERIKMHSECLIDACLNMCKDTDLNKDVFMIAGWLHDAGCKPDEKKQQKCNLEMLDKFLKEYPEYSYIKEYLIDCLKSNASEGIPMTVYGQVFKAADKISLRTKKWIEFKSMIDA